MTAERLHLHRAQTLLPQAFFPATLQPALEEAAETAEHDDDRPDQPEAGETGQEGVGALRHHHGSDGTGQRVPRGGRKRGRQDVQVLRRHRHTADSDLWRTPGQERTSDGNNILCVKRAEGTGTFPGAL